MEVDDQVVDPGIYPRLESLHDLIHGPQDTALTVDLERVMFPPRCGSPFGILSGLKEVHGHVGRADDLIVGTADRLAGSSEHLELVPDNIRTPADVGGHPILRHQPQRDPLAAPTDPQGTVRPLHPPGAGDRVPGAAVSPSRPLG